MASFFLKHPQLHSLKFRFIISALLMTLIILPIIGFTLSDAFEQHIKTSVKNELTAYSYSLLAVAEVESNALYMPEQLLENQFNIIQSGLYGIITAKNDSNNVLWHSHSMLGITPPDILPIPSVGNTRFINVELDNSTHFTFSFTVSFTSNKNAFPLTVHVIKNYDDFDALVEQFQQQLSTWLLILMGLLFLIQSLWLIWTLKPLKTLKSEMMLVEQGKLTEIKTNYPLELTQVTQQLNLLLRTERQQRKRYRNALSDLAHSLKTPLAVLHSQNQSQNQNQNQNQNQANTNPDAHEQLTIINQIIEHQLKRAQSAGESSWHIGVSIKTVVDKLLKSMEKIHHSRPLSLVNNVNEHLIFKGDEADLLEILGNLIDNACKAAKQQVEINASQTDNALTLTIADDGAGITDTMKASILNRGVRSDTYQQGHGIGLAIVRDLVESYQGELSIKKSALLGGAEFTLTFHV